MKKFLSLIVGIWSTANMAQVSKTVVVEHFTNTRCSVCAAQNPSFNQNLNLNPTVVRISYHPTSPYANCVLAQHNASENDARTNFYNLYGSTPRLAINGSPISNNPNPYTNPNLYDSYLGQNSPFRLRVDQQKTTDSIRVRVVLKTEGTYSGGDLRLYAAAAEDTIFYTSPNGETRHYNVFRKTFFGPSGITFAAPAQGDSLVWTASLARNQAWNFNRIFAYALVQNVSNRSLQQSDFRKPGESMSLTATNPLQIKSEFRIWTDAKYLHVEGGIAVPDRLELLDLSGRKLAASQGKKLELPSGLGGIYLLRIWTANQPQLQKIWVNGEK